MFSNLQANSSIEREIQLFVKSFGYGTTIVVSIPPSSTILELKEIISSKSEIPSHQQALIFRGKKLNDHQKVSDSGIEPESTIHFICMLPFTSSLHCEREIKDDSNQLEFEKKSTSSLVNSIS